MSRRNEKKPSTTTRRGIVEIRKEVEADGINHYYKAFKVTTPEQLMLREIFNLLMCFMRDHVAKSDRDPADFKDRVDHAQAVFELASEHSWKQNLLHKAGLKERVPGEDPFAVMDRLIRSLDVPVERSVTQKISVDKN